MIVNRTHVTVRGRVISVNPLHVTPGGNAVVNFRIAANERQFDPATQTWSDRDTFFVNVTCWDQLAKRVAAVPMSKQLVVVMGTLATRSYEKNGERRSYPEIRAQHVALDVLSMDALGRPFASSAATADPVVPAGDATVESAEGREDSNERAAAGGGVDASDGAVASVGDDGTSDDGRVTVGDGEPGLDRVPVGAGVGGPFADVRAPF